MIETEIPLKIIDVQGVSNQVLPEDLPNQYCSVLQNLYERRLGELMRKGGTQSITTTFPVEGAVGSVSGIDNAIILRKRTGEKIHVQAVHTNQSAVDMGTGTFVNLATPSYVTAVGGTWGTAIGTYPNTSLGSNGSIQLQYVGYGVNFMTETAVVRGVNNTLRITVPAGIDNRILGINVYVAVEVWGTSGTGVIFSAWVGYIDLNAAGTRGITYDFSQAPVTISGSPGTTGTLFGSLTAPVYSLTGTTGGTLIDRKSVV